jgi:hypothetical protein
MRTQQETIYRCEHCNRPMFGKGAMSRHEKYCKENPNNKHECFDFCKHLNKEVHSSVDNYENYTKHTDMICEKRDVKMYSFKFEKNYNKPATALNGLERMPLECDLHEYMDSYED